MPGISKYVPVELHEAKADPHPQYARKADLTTLVSQIKTTGVGTKGEKGDKGDTGADGATGPTGPQGPQGDTQGIIDGGFANSTYGPGGLIDAGGA